MIVDEAELRNQTFGDEELLREVVGLFVLQTPSLVAALEAAGGAARADVAHRLKGTALALGARALADAAARIEADPDDEAPLAEARRIAAETVAALDAIARRSG
jgi:HPt (histidine-containing phosphotransfer) domain-containing protein